jgi:hypothetical protein
MKRMNPTVGCATNVEESLKINTELTQLQSMEILNSIEKQPMTLKEVFSKMHWIQDTKKKAS